MDIDLLKSWIGKTETVYDQITLAPLQALAATLDRDDAAPQPGDPVAPCWQWLYFLPLYPHSGLGPDGHPQRGGFLPPVPLPRRMWAGSRLEFRQELRAGKAVKRTSRIVDVNAKDGRTGPLVFVQVRHEIGNAEGVAIVEEQDIVYREVSRPSESVPEQKAVRADEQFSRRINPDPVLLFRYSALTFNGHRIHYDRSYATGTEGYPGLVVHGPLIATMLIDQLHRVHPSLRVTSFEFRAVSPLFDAGPFEVCGRMDGAVATLWARGHDGRLAMQASAKVTHA
jgi:3-methylfumaryl-CoA hydratase